MENKEKIVKFGKWNEDKLNEMMQKSTKIKDLGSRIDFVSEQFLNVKYEDSTLIGSINTPEVLVINLDGMDCFTYIDYVESIQISDSFSSFVNNLQSIRYQSSDIGFKNRNHFFTDWVEFNSGSVIDVTIDVSGGKTKTVKKLLNKKGDGTYYLAGIPVKERSVTYIPSTSIDDNIIENLKTGDYVGIYTEKDGLDVSHTGIIIKKKDGVYLRHASSRDENRRVVDEDFLTYVSNKPGIVVLRPKQ
ncbi:MAG: N-acetylmuramoyl-L-alanine amidase-like domain-containing protein [Thermodesulfobacteriota bacterium]